MLRIRIFPAHFVSVISEYFTLKQFSLVILQLSNNRGSGDGYDYLDAFIDCLDQCRLRGLAAITKQSNEITLAKIWIEY